MLMAVALPRVMADLDISAATAQWLTTAYMLTIASITDGARGERAPRGLR